MSPSAVSLATIFAIVALGAAIGFLAGVRRKMNLEQWTVGGRGFGAVSDVPADGRRSLHHVLFSGSQRLGLFPWRPNPVHHGLPHAGLRCLVLYPAADLGGGPEVRSCRLNPTSSTCATATSIWPAFVCVVGIAFLMPYLQLQITGLGIIVSIASFDGIGRTPAMAISVVLLAAFVFASGVRAVAWVSVLKDVLMVFAALSIGIGIPYIHYGRHRSHVRRVGAGPAGTPDHARRHRQPRPHVVHLHGSSDFAGFLYVAARVWGHIHREKRRHVASQRRGDAALHHHARFHLLRWLHRGFGRARPAQWRPLAFDDCPQELPRRGSWAWSAERAPSPLWCPLPFSF